MFGLGSNGSQALSGNVRSLLCSMLLWGQARQLKGHAPTSTHGELQKTQVNLRNLAGSELLRVDYMRLGELQKGPSRFTQKMASLKWWWTWKGPPPPFGKIGKGIGLGELQKGPSFFLPGGPWNEQSWTIWGAAFLTKWNETLGIFQKQHLDEEMRMTSLILSIFRFPTFFLKSKPKIPRVR